MKAPQRKYYVILGIIALLYFLIQAGGSESDPIDWMESFSREDKTPYGTYILYHELDQLFPDATVFDARKTIYETLNDWEHYNDYFGGTTYLFVNDDFDADASDLYELFSYVEQGNQAFIAARFFPEDFTDSLGFETGAANLGLTKGDSAASKYFNPHLPAAEGFNFQEQNLVDYFTQIDTLRTTVLAYNNQGEINLIEVPWGEGKFYLCSAPVILTNYHLLHPENHRFVSLALSHLPAGNNLIWDEYYKVGSQLRRQYTGSPLQYINSQPALKYALWLLVASVVLYVLFELKRTQRIVPIVKPLPNSTLEFTETVGELYYQSRNHKNIAEKRIKIFLEHIRSQYFLKTDTFDEAFLQSLAGKAGVPKAEVSALFRSITTVQRMSVITENELIELSHRIDTFMGAGVSRRGKAGSE